MSDCCTKPEALYAVGWARRSRELGAWMVPSIMLALMPKCPACLAAYVALWTGLGLSFTTATYVRWSLLILCADSLLYMVVRHSGRFMRFVNGATGLIRQR